MNSSEFADFTNPVSWVNAKLQKDRQTTDTGKLDSYFNSLNLQLTVLANQLQDSSELKAAHFLSACPQIVKEAKQIEEELRVARALIAEDEPANKGEQLFAEMASISEAQEKVDAVRRALKRQSYRVIG